MWRGLRMVAFWYAFPSEGISVCNTRLDGVEWPLQLPFLVFE